MSGLPFTRKRLVAWAGEQAVRDAEQINSRGLVLGAAYQAPEVTGSILVQSRDMRTGFRILPDGNIENFCPCYTNKERGLVCAHCMSIAVALLEKYAETPSVDADQAHITPRPDRKEYLLTPAQPGTPGAVPARLTITIPADWREGYTKGMVTAICTVTTRGRRIPIAKAPRDVPLLFSQEDENLLFVVEDIVNARPTAQLDLTRFDLVNILRLHAGRAVEIADAGQAAVNRIKVKTNLRMDLDPETGELSLSAHTELPAAEGESPFYVISGRAGWAFGGGQFWPLDVVLPTPYQPVYEGNVTVPRSDVIRFLRQELPALSSQLSVESDISLDLFTIDPAPPVFVLDVRGSPASLSATLYADYAGIRLVAMKPDSREHFCFPDPEDLMRYTVRNKEAETRAMEVLRPIGFAGEVGDDLSSIIGNREVLNFLAGSVPILKRRGWKMEISGRVSPYFEEMNFATPVVHVRESAGNNWFDVAFGFEGTDGSSISPAEVQRALLRGESYVSSGGRTLLLDADAIRAMHDVFSDCTSGDADEPGFFRLSGIHAPFVKASLDALDGVDVEDTSSWRRRAEDGNRLREPPPVELTPALKSLLRPYQVDGVRWLRFLEANEFCGILADEMGLGKTVQALAWLELARCAPALASKPGLIVCPTSIVENWAEEAGRFVPSLRVVTISGPDREAKWQDAMKADLVVTSYALLRRDIDFCAEREFSVMILDEAQHIKNRSTQNAVSAKRVRAGLRLVLTGTPIENSVSDLWSIMDFLMPGYLGSHERFRDIYERPISRGGPDAEVAQTRLRRKLHPFMMRRVKRDVARDLPPRIEKVSSCSLTPDQRVVYNEILNAGRSSISKMVAQRGFQRSRMDILATLMKLRQTSCHLELLNLPGLAPRNPSGKLDLFFELLDEAMDGGHRVLVFSQFVGMLRLIERDLKRRAIDFCYLDGSTKDRMEIVHRFNTCREIPLFLISLKAGGTGLNLTGADMVIHFDPWWNPAVENQATDRAHRIGQKRTVYSVKLIAKDTVEEKVLALQQRKRGVIDAVMDDDSIPAQIDWEDIREILNL